MKRDIIYIAGCLIVMILACLITWDLVTPESWRIGIPEWLDQPVGLIMGIWLGRAVGSRL